MAKFEVGTICQNEKFKFAALDALCGSGENVKYFGGSLEVIKVTKSTVEFQTARGETFRKKIRDNGDGEFVILDVVIKPTPAKVGNLGQMHLTAAEFTAKGEPAPVEETTTKVAETATSEVPFAYVRHLVPCPETCDFLNRVEVGTTNNISVFKILSQVLPFQTLKKFKLQGHLSTHAQNYEPSYSLGREYAIYCKEVYEMKGNYNFKIYLDCLQGEPTDATVCKVTVLNKDTSFRLVISTRNNSGKIEMLADNGVKDITEKLNGVAANTSAAVEESNTVEDTPDDKTPAKLPDTKKEEPPIVDGAAKSELNGAVAEVTNDTQNNIPAPKVKVFGKSAKVITDDEKEFQTVYKVVEINEVIASHLMVGNSAEKNNLYPAELQPRDRENRVATTIKIISMANNIRPADLMASRNLNEGAPIVRSDGVVLNGNGRVMALSVAYENNKAENYRAELIKHATEFGFKSLEIERYMRPLLVRELITDNIDDIKSIVQTSAGGVKFSASEQSFIDAQNIKKATFSSYVENDCGDFASAENQHFISAVLQDITNTNDINSYICSDGKISVDGICRVKRALLAAAYKDSGVIARMAEATDDNIKQVSNALVNIAAPVAVLNFRISDEVAYNYELAKTIADAANKLSDLHDAGMPVDVYLKSQCLFEGADYTEESKALLKIFDKNKRSAKNITAILKNVIAAIYNQGTPKSQPLFDVKRAALIELIQNAGKNFESQGMNNIFVPEKETSTEEPPPVVEESATKDAEIAPPADSSTVITPTDIIDGVIKARIRFDKKGKVRICFNDVYGTAGMFEVLEKQGLNLETSYNLLLKAVLFGTAKTAAAKRAGDDKKLWSGAPKDWSDKWGSHYWAKRNLQAVAMAILDGTFKIKNNYKRTEKTDIKIINEQLAKIKFNMQKHSSEPAPVEESAPKVAKKTATPKATQKAAAPKNEADKLPDLNLTYKSVKALMKDQPKIDALKKLYTVHIKIDCL